MEACLSLEYTTWHSVSFIRQYGCGIGEINCCFGQFAVLCIFVNSVFTWVKQIVTEQFVCTDNSNGKDGNIRFSYFLRFFFFTNRAGTLEYCS